MAPAPGADFDVETLMGESTKYLDEVDEVVRRGFVRKVFGILAVQVSLFEGRETGERERRFCEGDGEEEGNS